MYGTEQRVCDCCRVRKKKCDGAKPCYRCNRLSYECEYTVNEAKRKLADDFLALNESFKTMDREASQIEAEIQRRRMRNTTQRRGSTSSSSSGSSGSSGSSSSSSSSICSSSSINSSNSGSDNNGNASSDIVLRGNPGIYAILKKTSRGQVRFQTNTTYIGQLSMLFIPRGIDNLNIGAALENTSLVRRPLLWGEQSVSFLLDSLKKHHHGPSNLSETLHEEQIILRVLECSFKCNPLPYYDRSALYLAYTENKFTPTQSLLFAALVAKHAVNAFNKHIPCNPYDCHVEFGRTVQEKYIQKAKKIFSELPDEVIDFDIPWALALIGGAIVRLYGDLRKSNFWFSSAVRAATQMNFHKPYSSSSTLTPDQQRRARFVWDFLLCTDYNYRATGFLTSIPADCALPPVIPLSDLSDFAEISCVLRRMRLDIATSKFESRSATRKAYYDWYRQIPEKLRYAAQEDPCVFAMACELEVGYYSDLILTSPVLKKEGTNKEKKKCVKWASKMSAILDQMHLNGFDLFGTPVHGMLIISDVYLILFKDKDTELPTMNSCHQTYNTILKIVTQNRQLSTLEEYTKNEKWRYRALKAEGH